MANQQRPLYMRDEMNWNIKKALLQVNTKQYRYRQSQANKSYDELDECLICFEAFKRGEFVRELKCGHEFHLDCSDYCNEKKRWTEMYCPVCRVKIVSADRPQK